MNIGHFFLTFSTDIVDKTRACATKLMCATLKKCLEYFRYQIFDISFHVHKSDK